MLTTLLQSGFSIVQLLKTIHSRVVLLVPCLCTMAVALNFLRETNERISANKLFIVDESPYRNVSSTTLKLSVFNVEFNSLFRRPTSDLAMVILSLDGPFIDNVFALLVLFFVALGSMRNSWSG